MYIYIYIYVYTHAYTQYTHILLGFPGSSAGKESTCNTGDPSLITRSGRSPGEGIGSVFFGFTSGSDSKAGMANHSSILAW